MKKFLSSAVGKIVMVIGGICVVAAVAAVVMFFPKSDDYRTIKVDGLNGTVTIINSKDVSVNAYEGMNLKSQDRVTVEVDSNMTLLLDMDKYMFAEAGTKFWIEATGNSEKGNTKTRIHLEEGSVLCRIDKKLGDDESYDVETPNSVMSVRGTVFRAAIYQDESGENYTEVDVLEGAVNVDLHTEDGEATGEDGLIESGKRAVVHSNPEISEFVVSDGEITYENYTPAMGNFIINTIDEGRELDVKENVLKHVTGMESHPETEKVVKEPSCFEEGKKDIYCETCNGVVRTEPIAKIAHTEGEWVIATEATCVQKTIEELHCAVCEEAMDSRELELGEHKYGDWSVSKKATCSEEGAEKRVCTVCNDEQTRKTEKVEHTFAEWNVVTAATCTMVGKETRTCSVCGEVEEQDINAKGHNYGAFTVTQQPACETAGSQERVCSNCQSKDVQAIAATGHSLMTHTNDIQHRWTYQANAQEGDSATGVITLFCERCKYQEDVTVSGTITGISGGTNTITCSHCGNVDTTS